jgi:hypothetical protein
VAASKRSYGDRGLAVANSFGRKYVEFATPSSAVKLALYGGRALAKDAGVCPTAPDRTGSWNHADHAIYDSPGVDAVARVLARAARPRADSWPRSMARAFSIRRARLDLLRALDREHVLPFAAVGQAVVGGASDRIGVQGAGEVRGLNHNTGLGSRGRGDTRPHSVEREVDKCSRKQGSYAVHLG